MKTWVNRNFLCSRYQRNQLSVYNYLTKLWLLFIIICFLQSSSSQSVVAGPGAWASPGNLLEMQALRPSATQLDPAGSCNLYFNKSSSWFWSVVKLESHYVNVCFKAKIMNLPFLWDSFWINRILRQRGSVTSNPHFQQI